MYGVRNDARTKTTETLTLWSGSFMAVYEATGKARDSAHQMTMTDYSGEKFVVVLPDNVTFPREDANYEEIDRAINNSYDKHNAKLKRSYL